MQNKINIGMITDNDFPPDIRIEKEAASLTKTFNIFILAASKNKTKKKLTYKTIKVTKMFNKFLNFILFIEILLFQNSFLWRMSITRFIKKNNISILHVHDLILLGPAIQAVSRAKVPIIADLHENYPAMMEAATKNKDNKNLALKITKIFFNLNKMRNYELNCLKRVDKVFVVIEEAKTRLIKLGICSKKIEVIANYN